MEKKNRIIILSQNAASPWVTAVTQAISPQAEAIVLDEAHIWLSPARETADLVLLDAGGFDHDVVKIVERLRRLKPGCPVVVASTSPTWQQARAVLKSGAVDYIRCSFDRQYIRQALLNAMANAEGDS